LGEKRLPTRSEQRHEKLNCPKANKYATNHHLTIKFGPRTKVAQKKKGPAGLGGARSGKRKKKKANCPNFGEGRKKKPPPPQKTKEKKGECGEYLHGNRRRLKLVLQIVKGWGARKRVVKARGRNTTGDQKND